MLHVRYLLLEADGYLDSAFVMLIVTLSFIMI
jgi:hypothetical protein